MGYTAREWLTLHRATNMTTSCFHRVRWWHRFTRRRGNWTLVISGQPPDPERIKRVLGDPFKGA